jgi:glyoxylase-like metal-dependent hydrolase (beta-lactamase superfamily II)
LESQLKYPFDVEPVIGDGSAQVVVPGLLWLRMPLSSALPFINVWAVKEDDGWSIIDTGVHSEATTLAWQKAFDGVMQGAPVARILVTHMHPDHCGSAGWLAERFSARLWMSRLEYLSCRLMAADTGHSAPATALEFYRSAGWDNDAIESYKTKVGAFGELIHRMPASYRRLVDKQTLKIGDWEWRVVVGSGHSPEHAC